MLDNIIENLELTEPHQAFFILKNCVSIPKLIYLLRSAPCFKCTEELAVFDTAIKTNMEKICNGSFGEENRSQASLPIRHAGLGLRSAADLSLSCFLSSSHACKGLVNRLLPSLNLETTYRDVNDAIDDWSKHHDSSPLEKGTQAAWDDLACRDTLNSLLNTNNLWNHCWLLAAQESHTAAWSEAFPIASVGNLLSPEELRIAIALQNGAKIFESTKCRYGKIVMSWGSMVSPVLKMQAASQGIQPSTPPSRGHWPALVSPLPWSLSARLTMEWGQMAWLWAPGTKARAWCGTQQLWALLLKATTKTLPNRLVLRLQKLRSQNAKNIMTSKAITTFNQWQLRPLVCMARPLPLFWVEKLVDVLGDPTSGSNSVCPWLWPREMLPAYWPVCKFDLTLPVLFLAAFNVLTTFTAYHLSLYRCVAIAFRILILSIRCIVPSVVQCYLVHWLNILSIAWPMIRVQCGFVFRHCLKPLSIKIFFIFYIFVTIQTLIWVPPGACYQELNNLGVRTNSLKLGLPRPGTNIFTTIVMWLLTEEY